jgi:ABC-type amino acid transport substrate-binding protein
MRTRPLLAAALLALVVPLAACGGDDSSTATEEPADETSTSAAAEADSPCTDATDLLAEICEKGVLTVSTDPAYPPASSLNEQTGEYEGFDIDVATEIATRLRPTWAACRSRT